MSRFASEDWIKMGAVLYGYDIYFHDFQIISVILILMVVCAGYSRLSFSDMVRTLI